MRLTIAAILAVLPAAPAAAETWVRVGGDEKAVEYVDADSLKRSGDEIRFRHQVRFAAPRSEGFDRATFASVASCASRKWVMLSMAFNLGDHELMSSSFRDDGKRESPAEAGTPMGRALAHACEATAAK